MSDTKITITGVRGWKFYCACGERLTLSGGINGCKRLARDWLKGHAGSGHALISSQKWNAMQRKAKHKPTKPTIEQDPNQGRLF